MTVSAALDAAGRRRSPATLPGFHAGRSPRNKGMHYPADPPTIEEIIAVMRQADDNRHGWRLRALIGVLWRGGLRIQEALSLAEPDLDPRRGSLLVRHGKGGRRREIGMDAWEWEQLRPWLLARRDLPVGPLFRIIDGPTRGRPWSSAAVRVELRRLATHAGVRRRFAPHQLRHAHAVERPVFTGMGSGWTVMVPRLALARTVTSDGSPDIYQPPTAYRSSSATLRPCRVGSALRVATMRIRHVEQGEISLLHTPPGTRRPLRYKWSKPSIRLA